jgi:D-alanyl-D-alanine carboxypeptidase
MTVLMGRFARNFVCLAAFIIVAACSVPKPSGAAPFAAIVQDARSGQILYSENAETRLHPASLTKMMTLYITFTEIERGNLSLDTMVTVSRNAANQPPSRLGLKAGQKIALRYLIRAAAVKSANDAAAAIGDYIGGDQQGFAKRMNQTAQAIGMKNSTFKNANGLTLAGHLSTAHDMNTLGRRLFYDFPQYYNIFSRRTTDAGIATVRNTNARFLDAYKGADGIKTGYTVPAGFNLTGSAERNGVRIIATVFGGTSTAWRNAKMAELLDLGFAKAPRNAPANIPAPPAYTADVESALVAAATDLPEDDLPEVAGGAGKTLRLQLAVAKSPRPMARPLSEHVEATGEAVDAISDSIEAALAEAVAKEPAPQTLEAQVEVAAALPVVEPDAASVAAKLAAAAPPARPETLVAPAAVEPPAPAPVELAAAAELPPAPPEVAQVDPAIGSLQAQAKTLGAPASTLQAQANQLAAADQPMELTAPVELIGVAPVPKPARRKAPIFDRVADNSIPTASDTPVVIRLSTSNARHWGINLGKFNTWSQADRVLMKIQLAESATLNEGLRKVVQKGGGYEANFMGLTQDQADLACRRLQARAVQCFTMGP